MALFSRIVVGCIVLWAIYSFYSIYQMVRIPDSLPGEISLTNGVNIGQQFDLHLYLTSDPNLRINSFKLVRNSTLPDRITPSMHQQVCTSLEQSTFHLLSFRTQYQSTNHGLLNYFKHISPQIQSILTCDYRLSNPIPIHHHHFNSHQSNLQFTLPHQLTKRPSPLYLLAIGTRTLTTNEQQHDSHLSLSDVTLFYPTIERLTTLLAPDAFKRPKRYLLKDPSQDHQMKLFQQHAPRLLSSSLSHHSNANSILQQLQSVKLTSVPHEVTLSVVLQHQSIPRSAISKMGLGQVIKIDRSSRQYFPPLSVNSLTSPRDEFIPLIGQSTIDIAKYGDLHVNNTTMIDHNIPIIVKYKPIGMKTWLLQHLMINSLNQLESSKMSLSSYDIDSLRIMMGGGNPLLVFSTFLISILHILFSFLAVSSDVSFWSHNSAQAAVGISHSSLVLEIILAFFIALYLYDVGQSKFVLLAVFGRIFLYAWKLWKIYRFNKTASNEKETKKLQVAGEDEEVVELIGTDQKESGIRQRRKEQGESVSEVKGDVIDRPEENNDRWKEIIEFETKWMILLLLLLIPIVLIVTIYQLIYVPQAGWLSWIIHSLALCSYAGGFVSMTPQLFRNYKLQSVDHLPWPTLTYQALNAFVDDFFAFIVRMPQMHRVSVFRDDIVFIVYTIQRRIYRSSKRTPGTIHINKMS